MISEKSWFLKPSLIFAALIILAFTPLKLLSLIACIVLWAMYIPFLSYNSRNTWVLRFIMAFVLTSCFQQVIAALAWVINIKMGVPLIVAMELAAVSVIIILRKGKMIISPAISKADVTSLGVALVSILSLLLLVFGTGNRLSQLIRISTTSWDDLNHISMTLSTYEQQGLVYGDHEAIKEQIIYRSMVSYPQGWHLVNGTWWRAISDTFSSTTSVSSVLTAFLVSRLVWYSVLIFLFCRLLLYIVDIGKNLKKPALSTYFLAISITVIFQLILGLDLFRMGFTTFIAQLVLTLALSIIVSDFLSSQQRKYNLSSFLIYSSLLVSGMSLTWLLAAPIGAGIILSALYINAGNKFSTLRKQILVKEMAPAILLALVIAAGGLVQLYVQLAYVDQSNQLNQVGSIDPINPFLMIGMLTLSAIAIFKQSNKVLLNIFIAAITSSLLISVLLYLYQLFSSGTLSYYSIKTTQIVFVLLFVFSGLALIQLNLYLQKYLGQLQSSVFILVVALFMLVSLQLKLPSLQFISGKWLHQSSSAQKEASLLKDHDLSRNWIILLKQENYAEDVIATRLFHTLSREPESQCSKQILESMDKQNYSLVFEALNRCPSPEQSYSLIVTERNKDEIGRLITNPNITLYVQ